MSRIMLRRLARAERRIFACPALQIHICQTLSKSFARLWCPFLGLDSFEVAYGPPECTFVCLPRAEYEQNSIALGGEITRAETTSVVGVSTIT